MLPANLFRFFSSSFSWAVTGNPSFPTSQKNRCPGISRTKAKSQTFCKVSLYTTHSLRISNSLWTLNYSRAKTKEQYDISRITYFIASMNKITKRYYLYLPKSYAADFLPVDVFNISIVLRVKYNFKFHSILSV